LARRATYLHSLSGSDPKQPPVLKLAGAYEFTNNPDAPTPPRKRLAFLAKAFDLMGYDVLHVSEHERAALNKAGIKPRKYWRGAGPLESQVLSLKNGLKVGLLILPPLHTPGKTVPPQVLAQVSQAVLKLRPHTSLIIAMCAWGYFYEQELVNSTGALPDLVLGSGPGIGLVGTKSANAKVMWIRPFAQGKSVERIDLYALPERNANFKWTEEQNIRMTLFGLTDQVTDDRRVLSLIQTMGTD